MFILSLIASIFSFSLGVIIFLRDRSSFVHRILALGLGFLGVEALISAFCYQASFSKEIIYWQYVKAIVVSFVPGSWLVFSMSFGRPNYREYINKWKMVVIFIFVFPLLMVTIFSKYFFLGEPVYADAGEWVIKLGWAGYLFHLAFLGGAILILMNMERALRASFGRIRWQIKFLVLGVGGYFGFRIYILSQTILFNSLDLSLFKINMPALIIACIFILKSLPRVQFLNVDFYLSSSLLYNSITVLFVGFYLIAVGILAQLFVSFDLFSERLALPIKAFFIFLGIMGLILFLYSDRLRRKAKIFISRHFKRPLYDYRKEWENFTRETTSVLEIKELCQAVVKMVSNTLEVLSVTIWLIDEDKDSIELGASTVFSERQMANNLQVKRGITELIRKMRQEKIPFDYDYWPENRRKEKDRMEGDLFQQARIRHCLPLVAGEKFLGVLTLGDKIGRDSFTGEDFDLLKTIADQTAAHLLNLKLLKQLNEIKEKETFRTMSAFIMHDLKNLASSLSLTIQNLPVLYDNPEFRQDAVRISQQNLEKINNLCAGLSALSQKIEIKKIKTNLHELIINTLSDLNISPLSLLDQKEAIKPLSPLDGKLESAESISSYQHGYKWQSKNGVEISVIYNSQLKTDIMIDPEQIQKVLTNLLLNSRDALKKTGEIRISTRKLNGWLEISVSDNGCGMSKEFLEKSLFRPFKTTKKKGMGIGLFQSKMIIEAHGGRIEVESQENLGTKFRIYLLS